MLFLCELRFTSLFTIILLTELVKRGDYLAHYCCASCVHTLSTNIGEGNYVKGTLCNFLYSKLTKCN